MPRPAHAVNTTPAYLFRKVSDEAGPPTILYDEIDTVFGPKAKDNEDVRGMLNAGHRRGATAGRGVVTTRLLSETGVTRHNLPALRRQARGLLSTPRTSEVGHEVANPSIKVLEQIDLLGASGLATLQNRTYRTDSSLFLLYCDVMRREVLRSKVGRP